MWWEASLGALDRKSSKGHEKCVFNKNYVCISNVFAAKYTWNSTFHKLFVVPL